MCTKDEYVYDEIHRVQEFAYELQKAWSASLLILFSKSQMAGVKPHRSLFHLADTLRAYGILINVSVQTWEASIKVLRRFVRGGGSGISQSGIQYGVGDSLLLGINTPNGLVEPSSASWDRPIWLISEAALDLLWAPYYWTRLVVIDSYL
jgi:hypothetical protein